MRKLNRILEFLRRVTDGVAMKTRPAELRTVLVVDDEEPIRRFVARVLRDDGWQTVLAKDGADAVAVAATMEHLDLLVTDLMMPNMNGDELARQLQTNERDLPVLYLTGFSDRLFADRMQLWAHEAFLDKPCTVKGLLEAIAIVSGRPVHARAV